MTSSLNLVISFTLLFIIIIYKIIEHKKTKDSKNSLTKQNKKISLALYVLTLIIFVISLIINISLAKNNSGKTLEYIINALSIALLVTPLSFSNLYLLSSKDEKYIYTKSIVTNIINQDIISKFNESGINLIILTTKNTSLKLPTYQEKDTKKYQQNLNQNIIIKTDNLKILDKLINKKRTIFEFNDLDTLYKTITIKRGIYDNYIRTIKYLIVTYLPIIISYFLLTIMGFPFFYNLLLVLILKITTIIISRYIYKNLTFDIDIMERPPLEKNTLFRKQDIVLLLIQSFLNSSILCLPYMQILAEGGHLSFANTLFYTIFAFSNIFISISYLSEENFLKNIFKLTKNKKLIICIIIFILFTIFINTNDYFYTRNIELHNYLSCILFGFITILFNELIKFARYMTKKGKIKNELKINQ